MYDLGCMEEAQHIQILQCTVHTDDTSYKIYYVNRPFKLPDASGQHMYAKYSAQSNSMSCL